MRQFELTRTEIREMASNHLEALRELREQEEEEKSEFKVDPSQSKPDQLKKLANWAKENKGAATLGTVGLIGAGMGVGALLSSGKRKREREKKEWWKRQAHMAHQQRQYAQAHAAGLESHLAGLRGQSQPQMAPQPPQVYHPQQYGSPYGHQPNYGYGY